MVDYKVQNHKAIVKGKNKIDLGFILWVTFSIGFSAFLSVLKHTEDISELMMLMSTVVILFVLVMISVRFQIELTKNHVLVRKTLFGINYTTIKCAFDTIQLSDSRIVFIERGQEVLQITNHEGFEIDGLLAVKGDSRYEIADKKEAEKAFELLTLRIKTAHLETYSRELVIQ